MVPIVMLIYVHVYLYGLMFTFDICVMQRYYIKFYNDVNFV